ncbi:MAG: Rz1-like lysis system protein LysC [Janthinobacterium lividum]
MRTPSPIHGLWTLCLLTLSACSQTRPLPAPVITLHECQKVTPCIFPPLHPRTNGELDEALHVAKAAWATCAAQVDMIADCQTKGPPND